MGRSRKTYEKEEKFIHNFRGRNLKRRKHLRVPGVDGSIQLKWILQIYLVGLHEIFIDCCD
jgi:hypothetical protein